MPNQEIDVVIEEGHGEAGKVRDPHKLLTDEKTLRRWSDLSGLVTMAALQEPVELLQHVGQA
jgi:hypothetical protein